MESNSVFVQPVLLKKLDERMRTHFLDSFKPFSTLARRLSPTLTEYSSYQTGQRILLNPRAIGCAMSFLSLQSCEMKAKGFSYRERSRALVGVRKTTSNPCSLVRCTQFPYLLCGKQILGVKKHSAGEFQIRSIMSTFAGVARTYANT